MFEISGVAILVLVFLPLVALAAVGLYRLWSLMSQAQKEIRERAEQVVRSILTAKEYEQLLANGYLEVPSPSNPHRVYRIPSGAGMVTVVERGQCVERLCAQSTVSVPEREAVVIHKLMIEGNEQGYLETANHFPCINDATANSSRG